jgi:hypothetical protein
LQSSGTLAELSLEGILDTVAKDRATGTLHIRSGDGEATLYFLFGHLFHAVDAADQGEPVVHRVLDWSNGDFTFDAKAKLPAEETIKVSTTELLANRPSGGASSNGSQPAAETAAEPEATAPEAEAPAAEAEADAPAEAEPDAETSAEAEPAPEPVVEASTPEAAAASDDESSDAKKRRRTDVLPETRPPETMILYPVPLGKTIHEGLTAGFVDFPKLLRSLAKDKHSGYVRLSGDEFTGVLLFSAGAVVEAIYDGKGQVSTGSAAFHQFGERIDDGDGGLDVIQLSPEMVTGIYQLLTANSLYDKLLARFIKADALLEYLGEQGTSGAVIVRHGSNTGIVLFREGKILGSYTDSSREVDEDARKVVALCEEPAAEIEVRGGPVPATLPVMEPDSQGGIREVPSGSAPAEVPAEAPESAEQAEAAEAAPAAETAPAEAEAESPAVDSAAETAAPAGDGEAAGGEEDAKTEKVDWAGAINEMAGRSDTVLGTRSKKVKELLYGANHNRQSIDGAIEKVSELSIMFVDPSKLSSLAAEFRQIAEKTGS